jgi:hypothetical protein
MAPLESVKFVAPAGSAIAEQNRKRPDKNKKKRGVVDETCTIYPSNDVLGRRECSEISPVLTEMERNFLKQRQHLFISEDVSGELLGVYGLYECLESLKSDETSKRFSDRERAQLSALKAALHMGLKQGNRYGMPCRATFVETF